jgi:hypothetical protein
MKVLVMAGLAIAKACAEWPHQRRRSRTLKVYNAQVLSPATVAHLTDVLWRFMLYLLTYSGMSNVGASSLVFFKTKK